MVWTPFCFALRMLNSNRCGFIQLPRALRAHLRAHLRALSGSPSVSSFSSGECGNAILQYCYGFNRLHLWLLAQGLLQSVPSFQVSVQCHTTVLLWFQ